MKTSTNIKRVVFALILAAYSAVFFSGCLFERDHHDDYGGHDHERGDMHDHEHDHDDHH